MTEWVMDGRWPMGDIPKTVPAIRAPAVITNITYLWNFELWSPARKGLVQGWGKIISVSQFHKPVSFYEYLR